MGPVCLVCLFNFPQPEPRDIEQVKQAVESYYSRDKTPWSEVAGPFATIQLHLLTPDWGTAGVTLTWIGLYGNRIESHRLIVTKAGGVWKIANAIAQ